MANVGQHRLAKVTSMAKVCHSENATVNPITKIVRIRTDPGNRGRCISVDYTGLFTNDTYYL